MLAYLTIATAFNIIYVGAFFSLYIVSIYIRTIHHVKYVELHHHNNILLYIAIYVTYRTYDIIIEVKNINLLFMLA